ncbi:MAG: phosphatase PAP2 family protein, partial [Ignavibacteria bacterium]|nr:phosphatase PAP2 family protein [Ignavibacteria bacterium]
ANENALPSGHAILSFSLSSVIAAHVENCWLKTLIFTPAVVTGISRIYQNQHWTSDVFLGGMLGYIIGDFLVSSHSDSDDKISFGFNQLGQFGLFYKF